MKTSHEISQMMREYLNKNWRYLLLRWLSFWRDKIRTFQEETGNLYNLEAPSRGAQHTAKEDKSAIQTSSKQVVGEYLPINSTQLPANFGRWCYEALDLQDDLQTSYTGGTVFHLIWKKGSSARQSLQGELVKSIISNYKLPYYNAYI